MQIVFALVALVVGFVLLVKGADWFVEGSAGIANKFGIPQIVIGLTIVAMGTSMPEAAVSISAALRGTAYEEIAAMASECSRQQYHEYSGDSGLDGGGVSDCGAENNDSL